MDINENNNDLNSANESIILRAVPIPVENNKSVSNEEPSVLGIPMADLNYNKPKVEVDFNNPVNNFLPENLQKVKEDEQKNKALYEFCSKVNRSINILKYYMLILGIFQIAIIVYAALHRQYFEIIIRGINLVLLFMCYISCKEKSFSAGILGILVAIPLLFNIIVFNVIDFMLGIFVLIHSITYLILLKKRNYIS